MVTMHNPSSKITSVYVVALMAIGLLVAITRGDIYWVGIALWGLFLVAYPALRHRDVEVPGAYRLMPLATVPFIIGLFMDMEGGGLLPITSPWYWLSFSVAIFSLSLVTVAYSDIYGDLKTNLSFELRLAFMLYMSMVTLQGPIFYYGDLWLGTDILASNEGLMFNILINAIAGLVLTLAFYYATMRAEPRGNVSEREEGAV
ncbi:MAG: hypothetical protein GXX95_00640 [Methanomassiliicoccus sp.]|nr:hypothetical protein [Methanomassiliicoccus sp.]